MSSIAKQSSRKKNHRDQAGAPSPSLGEPSSTRPDKEFIIAVMGVTGSGKSSLIREITGNSEVGVSHSLNSFTEKVTPYNFEHEGTAITLVDTPGFNDTTRSDLEVLTEISRWARETYGEGRLLSGIIYLHRISDIRMEGADLRSLRLFKSLVGEKFMKNVLLTTTHWSRVTREEGERREEELRDSENFWGALLAQGATLTRYEGDQESGFELLHRIVPYKPRILDIQHELVNQRKNLVETSAGQAIKEELKRMQGKHEEDMRIMEDEFREAVAVGDDEVKDILEREQKEIAAKIEQLKAAQKVLSKAKPPAGNPLYIDELRLLPNREALLIYVKATLETGNVGSSGSLLSTMLDAELRSRLAIQGVYYSPVKSVFSALSGGSRKATQSVLRAIREGIECSPEKKIFLCGYGQGAMIIRRALSELRDPERVRISGAVFVDDFTRRGSKVPETLEDRLLKIRLPFNCPNLLTPLPRTTYYFRDIAFPDTVEFIWGKLGES